MVETADKTVVNRSILCLGFFVSQSVIANRTVCYAELSASWRMCDAFMWITIIIAIIIIIIIITIIIILKKLQSARSNKFYFQTSHNIHIHKHTTSRTHAATHFTAAGECSELKSRKHLIMASGVRWRCLCFVTE